MASYNLNLQVKNFSQITGLSLLLKFVAPAFSCSAVASCYSIFILFETFEAKSAQQILKQ